MIPVKKLINEVSRCRGYRVAGKLCSATGVLTCTLPAAVGDQCEIVTTPSPRPSPGEGRGDGVPAEVIGFATGMAYLTALRVGRGVSSWHAGHLERTRPVGAGR